MPGIELADQRNPSAGPEVCGDTLFKTQTRKVDYIWNLASDLQIVAILGVFVMQKSGKPRPIDWKFRPCLVKSTVR